MTPEVNGNEADGVTPVLVNVCGAQRSGTTMLDLMLGSGDRAFSCGEIYARFRPLEPRHHRIDCACGEAPCPVWAQIADLPEHHFHRGVADRLGRRTVVDSSKAADWVRDASRWARDDGMRVENVLIWKDPLSLGYSFWKRGWLRGVDGPQPATGRRKSLGLEVFVIYYEEFFEGGMPHVTVSYSDLASAPGAVLASLCSALGLPYRPGQERFWETRHHHLFGSGTVSKGLRSGQTGISDAPLPPEYLAAAAAYAAEIDRSERAQAVIAELERTDVRRLSRATKPQQASSGPPHA
jgi:hypothetical protein